MRTNGFYLKLVSLALTSAFGLWSPLAAACACCGGGTGSDDPLAMTPAETNKLFLGLARSGGYANYDQYGSQTTAGGPNSRETITLAYGRRFLPRAFATITVPFQRNTLGGDAQYGTGDPSLTGRYSLVVSTFATPWLPQVQAIAGYRYGQARSTYESRLVETQLDVFGTGFSEAKAGIDVWFANAPVRFGAALLALVPQARAFDGHNYDPGSGVRATGSLGYGWTMMQKTTAGAITELRQPLRIDGEAQPDSAQRTQSLFISHYWTLNTQDEIRVSALRAAAFGDNYNTARADTLSLAVTRVL